MAPKKSKAGTGDPNGTHASPPELHHSPYHYDTSEPFEESYTGHCFCGTIQFSLSGDPLLNVFCHCRSCQRLHGAPATLSSIYPKSHVRFTSGVDQLVFWSPQKRESGYTVPCKMTCGNCHSPVANEGERTVLMMPALIDFSKKYPDDKSKRDQSDSDQSTNQQSNNQESSKDQSDQKETGEKQAKDGEGGGGDVDAGHGRLPPAFRPSIHQHYETRIRDIQDDLPKFAKEKNNEPLNQAARDFMEKSKKEKEEKEQKKKQEDEKKNKDDNDGNDEKNKDDEKSAKHDKTPPKSARGKRQKKDE